MDRRKELCLLSFKTPLNTLPEIKALTRAVDLYIVRKYGRHVKNACITVWVSKEFNKQLRKGRKLGIS